MATLEPFSGGMLNLKRFAARSLNLEENKINNVKINLSKIPYVVRTALRNAILKIGLKFVVNRMEIVAIRLRAVLKNMPPENSSSVAILYFL